MSKMKRNLSQLLNTALDESDNEEKNVKKNNEELIEKKDIISNADETDLDADYKLARQELHDLIMKNGKAIDTLIDLSVEAESPRAFEVLGQLIKTNTELVKELLGNYKRMKDLKLTDDSKLPQNITNNTFFTGSSKDLLNLLVNIEEEKNIIDIEGERDDIPSG